MTGLQELVGLGYRECLRGDPTDWPARAVINAILGLVEQGQYLAARRIANRFAGCARLGEMMMEWDPAFGTSDQGELLSNAELDLRTLLALLDLRLELTSDLRVLTEAWGPLGWASFAWACDLAERIDSFLAVLERDEPAASLARGCRQDLDGLLVLADWCEDTDRALSAAEARHLHGLVRHEVRFRARDPIQGMSESSGRYDAVVE